MPLLGSSHGKGPEQDLPARHEKEEGKLAENFSIFKARFGPTSMSGGADIPEQTEEKLTQEDEADFDVAEDEEEEAAPEEPPEPEWPDLVNGPLNGTFDVTPYMGPSKFDYATYWPMKKVPKHMLI